VQADAKFKTKDQTLEKNKTEGERPALVKSPWLELGVLIFYFGLTVLLTWPLILNVGHAVPFGPPEDRFQNFWNFWWVSRALSHFQNPYQTDVLFYPYYNGGGINPTIPLYLHTLQLLNMLVGLPLFAAFGPAAAYNSLIFFAFSLSGLGAFLLARHLTKNFWAGLLAGIVYSFSLSHFASVQFSITNIMSIQWLPFFAWALWLWHERRDLKLALLAGLFLAFVIYTDWYNTLFVLFYAGFFYVLTSWPRKWLTQLRGVGTALLCGGLLGAVAVIPAFFTLRSPIFAAQLDQNRDIRSSKTLLDVINPFQTFDAVLFWIGLLIGIGLIIRGGKWRRAGAYWLSFYLLCSLFTLGPRLQINQVGSEPNPTGIPLPYAILKFIPGASVMRSPDRFDIPGQLALALILAYGFTIFTHMGAVDLRFTIKRFSVSAGTSERNKEEVGANSLNRKSKIVNRKFLVLVLALPYLWLVSPAPMKLVEVAPDDFVKVLPKTGSYNLLELPITRHYNFDHERMLNQIYYQQPIMGGYLARPVSDPYRNPDSPFRYFADQTNVYGNDPDKDIFPAQNAFALLDNLARLYNFRYIVVYKDDYKFDRERQGVRNLIETRIGASALVQENEHTILYKVPDNLWQQTEITPGLFVGQGWYNVEQNADSFYRWLNQSGDLYLTLAQPRHIKLSLEILAFGGDRPLRLSLNGQKIFEGTITPAPQPLEIEFDAPAGTSALHFESLTPAQTAKDLGQGQDNRPLTFLVRKIKLQ
jgi:hypothetical protein